MSAHNREKIIKEYDALLSPEEESELYSDILWDMLPLIIHLNKKGYLQKFKDEKNEVSTDIIDLSSDLLVILWQCQENESLTPLEISPLLKIFIPEGESGKPKEFAKRLYTDAIDFVV